MPVDATTLISTEQLAWAEVARQILPDIWDRAGAGVHKTVALNERDLGKTTSASFAAFSSRRIAWWRDYFL